MKISTKGRYALRLMVDLAQHKSEGTISLKDISQRQEISLKYLEQIVPPLSKGGLIKSVRGSQGGYYLLKDPKDYTVLDILTALEGPVSCVACLDTPVNTCPRYEECLTIPFYEGLNQMIIDYMSKYTLDDLVNKRSYELS